jgi:hypothetical protein
MNKRMQQRWPKRRTSHSLGDSLRRLQPFSVLLGTCQSSTYLRQALAVPLNQSRQSSVSFSKPENAARRVQGGEDHQQKKFSWQYLAASCILSVLEACKLSVLEAWLFFPFA